MLFDPKLVFEPKILRLLTSLLTFLECDIRVWDLVKKECAGVLSGHDSSVTCLGILLLLYILKTRILKDYH